MVDDRDNPRLTVRLTHESAMRLRQNLEHGERRRVFQAIVDDLNDAIEKHGREVIGGIILRQIKLEHFVNFNEKPIPTCPYCDTKMVFSGESWNCDCGGEE